MSPPRPEPFFLDAEGRRLFAVFHPAAAPQRGAVLHVPAFAEEMNKSRRMVALQARELAQAGFSVLALDLHGTGDSEGDHGDARWATWIDDVQAARRWMRERTGFEPVLWGLRLGALLASTCAALKPPPALLLWQPVVSGKQHLQQFLRLRAGAEWLDATAAAEPAASRPMDELRAGQSVEVAGYVLHPELALPMAQAELRVHPDVAVTRFYEVSSREPATLSPAIERLAVAPPGASEVSATVVRGSGFWQALEIEEVPALLSVTTAAVRRLGAG